MSIAIEQHGKTAYSFVEGDPDKQGKPFTAETQLQIASVTKIMTSTLIIRLVEDGKISLYDNVRRFIPEFPFDDVLILHLMTHTSGCQNKKGNFPKQKQLFYESMVREFPCDTQFLYYSNGYDVLADVIERISGMTIKEFGYKIIFEPLKMNHSEFSLRGGGDMRSTAEDLLKFSRHILDVRKTHKAGILKPCSVDLMFREHTRGRYDRTPAFFLKSETRVFGRYFGDLNSMESVGHAGASGCFLLLDPKYDLSIVILTNGSNTIQSDDANFIRINNLLMGQFAK
jgi:CubicO group peptidase (beta-lactamase class C family)